MVKVIKRDGRIKDFDKNRIKTAIQRATDEVCTNKNIVDDKSNNHLWLDVLVDKIQARIKTSYTDNIHIEEIQDIIIDELYNADKLIAKSYKEYRDKRERIRISNYTLKLKNEIIETTSTENSNANIDENNFGGKELRIVETIEKNMANNTLPKDIVELNDKTILKQHDYPKTVLGMHNCLLLDYPKLLHNGFSTRQGDTKPANSYQSACQLLAVIIQTQSLDQFGGCGLMNFSIYMIPFLKKTIAKEVSKVVDILDLNIEVPKELSFLEARELLGDKYLKAKKLIDKSVEQAHQALITNLVTLQSRSGHQLPFSSINLGLIDWENEEESAYIIEGFLKELYKGIGKRNRTAIFPITCFQVKKGVNRFPNDKYYNLRMLAQKVLHKRLYPTIVNCDWSGNKASCWEEEMNIMGCRTMTGFNIFKQNYNKLGRGNNLPVSINLPYLALECDGNVDKFFDRLNGILDCAKRSLLIRYDIMKKQKPSVAPFMYGNQTIMDADKCTTKTEKALRNNSLAIGYIGVAECVKALTGYYHCENKESENLGVKIVKTIRDYCDKCVQEEGLNFVTYASPSEGYSEQALQGIRKQFGIIEGVSDKEYITNSHHCPVELGVPVFKKIDVESRFAKYANGGNIFHIEVDGANYNEKAITKAIDYALEKDIPYIRISHPIATCMDCGYSIGAFMNKCEHCGSENVENLAIVTGYLTTDKKHMNLGKQDEVNRRELNIYE